MIVLNHYLKSILYNTYIFEGKTEIDHLYFIKEIEKGIKQKENKSYSSHVRSEMTSFKYFLDNLKFNNFLNNIKESFNFHIRNVKMELYEAWGNKIKSGEYVKTHNHTGVELSGVLYLTNEGEETFFPEYNLKIKPEIGKFIIFEPILSHGVATNKSKDIRYTIAFNFRAKGY
jgi:hypothetical protein